MRSWLPWLILIGIFLCAGEGINLLRIGTLDAAAGEPGQWWRFTAGLLMTVLGTAYLGGFIYYRDKKRGRVKTRNWRP